jgi:hypothetical protein
MTYGTTDRHSNFRPGGSYGDHPCFLNEETEAWDHSEESWVKLQGLASQRPLLLPR